MRRSVNRLRPKRRPVFLWQAGLILLPVLMMAAVATTAIVRSRGEVERAARQQAEEVAQQYSHELERSWGLFLMRHDWYAQQWSQYLSKVTGAWPGSKQSAHLEDKATSSPAFDAKGQMAEWQAQFPGLVAEEVFPDGFAMTAAGSLRDGLEFDPAPQPPAWFAGLSLPQRAAWEALNTAASSKAGVEEIEQCVAQLQETKPEPEAVTNAAFISLRARLATLPPKQAVAEALHFAQESRETLSETGLPLASLAFGEALRYARAAGPSEALWDAIPGQVLSEPSPLIPILLDQLAALADTNTPPQPGVTAAGISGADTNSPLQASVRAWQTLWNARLKLYEIADTIRRTGKLQGVTTANFWIEQDRTRWLCILNPQHVLSPQAPAADDVEITNEVWTQVRFLPEAVAERALALALANSEVKLPDYLGLAAWLEGEPMTTPRRWSPSRGTNAEPALMAEVSGRLSNLGKLLKAPGGPEIEWESLPSRPRFVLQLYLANPARLFASYRRHALLLAGLVAASAFAALVGVVASWRAFQRQLRLNELKSNFVSSVSHELRAPIASVRLMAESLERGKVPDAPKQHEYFRFMVQECRRLSSLIENVLDFSRIEQDRKQYDFEPTDLVALTRETVKLMETYAAERGVKLQLVFPALPAPEADAAVGPAQDPDKRPLTPSLSPSDGERVPGRAGEGKETGSSSSGGSEHPTPPSSSGSGPSTINYPLSDYQLAADGKALQQALINLIDNALKHSPKGETVTVGLELEGQKAEPENIQHPTSNIQHPTSRAQHPASSNPHPPSRITHHASRLLLWVEDHGEGIPPAEHDKIFERFYRRGSELRRQTQGVGIGLSIVKHIVEAHGGRVLVCSAVGQGSRFTIELPLSPTTSKSEIRNPRPE